jgi:hypothetical protein
MICLIFFQFIAQQISYHQKAQLNHFLWKMEDPEVVMNQAVTDLNGDLAQVRQSYAEVLASQRRMERDRNLSEEEAAEVISRLASLCNSVCSRFGFNFCGIERQQKTITPLSHRHIRIYNI